MNTATPHGNDNSHSASIQIDPPTQPVPSTTTNTPFPLPTHRPRYNDDDGEDSGDEDGPLLGASSGGPSGRRHHQQLGDEPAPFLYRLHDWLAGVGTSKFLFFVCFGFVKTQNVCHTEHTFLKQARSPVINSTLHHLYIELLYSLLLL